MLVISNINKMVYSSSFLSLAQPIRTQERGKGHILHTALGREQRRKKADVRMGKFPYRAGGSRRGGGTPSPQGSTTPDRGQQDAGVCSSGGITCRG